MNKGHCQWLYDCSGGWEDDWSGWRDRHPNIRPDLSYATLRTVNLYRFYLKDANFRGAKLIGVNFTRADLRGVDFRGANLVGTNFYMANVAGADFTGANLRWSYCDSANFQEANLTDADVRDTEELHVKKL